ncbi:hypothetical protein [Streptomyces sp. NPDC048442]|uniref:hypothetical protein n=1 Tax=Streptomyces sp. NPDC048442 TaxID=3154823 RepID=UPI00341F1D58
MPTVDPSDPDTFEEDSGTDEAEDLPDETPEADAAEQHTDVRQERDDPLTTVDPDSANEADSVEQSRVVTLDEDDYR